MGNPVTGLDHLLVLVDGLDRARAQYQAMGFTVSPRGLHSEKRGTANHTVMLEGAYIELLGILQRTPLNAERRASMAVSGPGLHGLAFRIDDAATTADRLAARGVRTHTPSDFSRPVPLADGGEAVASFRTHQMDRAQFPVGMAFLCQHLTPELLWQSMLMDHPNTATHIIDVIAVSDDPAGDAALFTQRLGYRLHEDQAGACALPDISPGPGMEAAIRLMSPAAFADRFAPACPDPVPRDIHAAIRIAVRDLDLARAAMARAGGHWHEVDDGLAIPPDAAAGVLVVLSQPENHNKS